MDTESWFYQADRTVISNHSVISPPVAGQDGPTVDGRRISGQDALMKITEDGEVDSEKEEVEVEIKSAMVAPGSAIEEAADEVRQPKLPHNPGRPTKKAIREHCVSHWPFRSWCRHCVCGRAVSSPHKTRTEADREFGRERIPTLSMDHCFLGTAGDEEKALTNPFLILVDSETEAIFAIAVPDKAPRPWIVEYVVGILNDLGYVGMKIAIKHDQAAELRELRRQISVRRSVPTVPIDVPVRESKANGAVEKAVRTWQGQFRTLKSQIENSTTARGCVRSRATIPGLSYQSPPVLVFVYSTRRIMSGAQ